jgi:hypothetical protein
LVFNNILDKENYCLSLARSSSYSSQDLETIRELSLEHSNHVRLGRVFGYSVSDYALATLKWLNTEETNLIFDELYSFKSNAQKEEADDLIRSNIYLQFN